MRQPHSTSNSSSLGYRVEVRDDIFDGHSPIMLADGMVTDKWREISTRKYPFSPPTFASIISLPEHRCDEAALHDLMPYATAEAFAKWLVALYPLSQLRCRIAAYRLEWTSALYREGIVDEEEIVTEVSPKKMFNKPKIKSEQS